MHKRPPRSAFVPWGLDLRLAGRPSHPRFAGHGVANRLPSPCFTRYCLTLNKQNNENDVLRKSTPGSANPSTTVLATLVHNAFEWSPQLPIPSDTFHHDHGHNLQQTATPGIQETPSTQKTRLINLHKRLSQRLRYAPNNQQQSPNNQQFPPRLLIQVPIKMPNTNLHPSLPPQRGHLQRRGKNRDARKTTAPLGRPSLRRKEEHNHAHARPVATSPLGFFRPSAIVQRLMVWIVGREGS